MSDNELLKSEIEHLKRQINEPESKPSNDSNDNVQRGIVSQLNSKAVANPEDKESIKNCLKELNTKTIIIDSSRDIKLFLVCFFIIIPLKLLLISRFLGIILFLIEDLLTDNKFIMQKTYNQVAAIITGSSLTQHNFEWNNNHPETNLGISFIYLVSLQVIVFTSVASTLVTRLSLFDLASLDDGQSLLIMFIGVPIGIALISLPLTGILMIKDSQLGFNELQLFTLSNILQLDLRSEQPEHNFSIFIARISCCYQYSFLGVLLGIGRRLKIFNKIKDWIESLFKKSISNEQVQAVN